MAADTAFYCLVAATVILASTAGHGITSLPGDASHRDDRQKTQCQAQRTGHFSQETERTSKPYRLVFLNLVGGILYDLLLRSSFIADSRVFIQCKHLTAVIREISQWSPSIS